MANDLTGDYDAVAAFSLPAIDRILAAMHRAKRFPHSLSMAVNDLDDFLQGPPSGVAITDSHGDAVSDATRVKWVAYTAKQRRPPLTQEAIRYVDPIVNWSPDQAYALHQRTPGQGADTRGLLLDGMFGTGTDGEPIMVDASFLSGVALLALGPPTIQIPDGQSERAQVHTPAFIHYRAEPHTLRPPDFLRGKIKSTFGIKYKSSPAGQNIVVDLAGEGSDVKFEKDWASDVYLATHQTAIDKALYRSLRNSFQPSTTSIPSDLRQLHLKAFAQDSAVALLMNLQSTSTPSPASVGSVFLRPEDHFSLAFNGDLVVAPLLDAVNHGINPRVTTTPVPLHIPGVHLEFTSTVLDARIDFIDVPTFPVANGRGQLRLVIPVQVRFHWENLPFFIRPQDFDFTIEQLFTLTISGRTVGLQRLGDVGIVFPDGLPDYETGPSRTAATNLFNGAWDALESGVQEKVRKAFSASPLQKLLRDLMNPATPGTGDIFEAPPEGTVLGVPTDTSSGTEYLSPDLNYTYFEIRPSGIILYGSLAVPAWSAPHVEFDQDAWTPPAQPEYTALNSWIPGGTIQQYAWNYQRHSPDADPNQFVTTNAPALLTESNWICLTFSGTRITAAGPIFYEDVSSPRVCMITSFPFSPYPVGSGDFSAGDRPHVAVPKPGPIPELGLDVVAHASPWTADGSNGAAANVLVHFPDAESVGELDTFTSALAGSERSDASAAIVCVLRPQQISAVRQREGLLYADDADSWENLLGVRDRPATVLLNPSGAEVWRQEGQVRSAELADVLRSHLVPSHQHRPRFLKSRLRIGQPSPNFVFSSESGQRITLRNLQGRPVALLFWRSLSAPSLATLRNLQNVPDLVVLAINDGEQSKRLPTSTIIVPDQSRQISSAYGIRIWPTTVFLGPTGLVESIRLGLIPQEDLQIPSTSRPRPESEKADASKAPKGKEY